MTDSLLPPLTEAIIQQVIPSPHFERGRSYYANGAVLAPAQRGFQLQAYCEGSEAAPYRVQVQLNAQGIVSSTCTCPVGGHCKHVVALLLAWVHQPQTFRVLEDITALLERKTKAELMALVQTMLAHTPDLETLLDLPLPASPRQSPVDPEVYRQRLRLVFRRANPEDWHSTRQVAMEIMALNAIGDGFAEKQDWANTALVYQTVAEETLANFDGYQDENEIGEAINDTLEGLKQCVRMCEAVETRLALWRTLFEVLVWDIQAGGMGLSEGLVKFMAAHADVVERAQLRAWAQAALKPAPNQPTPTSRWQKERLGDLWLQLSIEPAEVAELLQQAPAFGLYQALFTKLLGLHQWAEAEQVAQQYLCASAWDRLQAAAQLEAAGRVRAALTLVEAGLPDNTDVRLFEWLAERYAQAQQPARVLAMLQAAWQVLPTAELYTRLQQTGAAWDILRPQLLHSLEERRAYDLWMEILVSEQDWPAAWQLADRVGREGPLYLRQRGLSLALKVANACAALYPARAAAIYVEQANTLIQIQGRENYRSAAQMLLTARALYQQLDQQPQWAELLAQLRQQHRTKRALLEELTKAGL